MTDDGKQKTESSGPLVSSMMSITDSEIMVIAHANATKVIPFLTNHPSNRAYAWNVAALISYNSGLIPRIYMWWAASDSLTDEEVLSNVRVNLQGIRGSYSVRSRPSGKALICVSSSRETNSPVSSPQP